MLSGLYSFDLFLLSGVYSSDPFLLSGSMLMCFCSYLEVVLAFGPSACSKVQRLVLEESIQVRGQRH